MPIQPRSLGCRADLLRLAKDIGNQFVARAHRVVGKVGIAFRRDRSTLFALNVNPVVNPEHTKTLTPPL